MGGMRTEECVALASVLVRVLQGNGTNRTYIYRKRFVMRNWLLWLWRLSPKMCSQQMGDPGKLGYSSKCRQAGDPGRAGVSVQVWKQEKNPASQLESSQEFSLFLAGSALLCELCLQLIGWGPPSLGEAVVCFPQVYQTRSSHSEHIFSDTPRITFDQTSGHSEAQAS